MSPPVSSLPIDEHLPTILDAIRAQSLVLVQAQPGSGKTTRLPAAMADDASGQVWVLEPRRLAAVLAAQHVAELRSERCGETIGFKVRHEASVSNNTKVLFLTEGMFLRLLHGNPTLQGVSHIVLDEFHERHLQTDTAFAVARYLQLHHRPDLKLVVMSATLDIKEFEAAFPGTRTFDIPGRTFPVETKYLGRNRDESIAEAAARGVIAMAQTVESGNILAFLPGTSEIFQTCERLQAERLAGFEVVPLTAAIQANVRAQLFEKQGRRKVIVATNVAESSVTLPHITGVVDTGLAKIPGHAAWSGLPTLALKKVPQSSCIQRQGRAGRTGPGLCFRMYTESDFVARDEFLAPEIERLDLSETILELAELATRWNMAEPLRIVNWPWLSPPRHELWDQACALLRDLGAIDAGGITKKGIAMARWPFHPRLAAVVEHGIAQNQGAAALAAACLVNEGGIATDNFERGKEGATKDAICDVAEQLRLWRDERTRYKLDRGATQRFEKDLQTLTSLLPPSQRTFSEIPDLGPLLFAGFFDRVAKKRVTKPEQPGRAPEVTYNFCLGRGGRLSRRSRMRSEEYLLCLDASEDPGAVAAATGTLIHLASSIKRDFLLASQSSLLRKSEELQWNEKGERVEAMSKVWFGQLLLEETKVGRPSDAGGLLAKKVMEKWPKPFEDDEALVRHNAKVAALRAAGFQEELPLFVDEMFQLLIEMICEGKTSFEEVARRPLAAYIRDQLSYEQASLLEHLLPDRLALGNGREVPLRYGESGDVWAVGFVQDFYGLASSPRIAEGRIVVKAEMLGPHKRPVQTTGDLAAFWSSGYPALVKDLKGRYPKHYWPEEPDKARPVLTKSRLSN